jgi:queuine tRNA-ribosyltransferase
MFKVTAENEETNARTGVLSTAHGDFETPFFMPVATKGCVKTLSPEEVKETGTEVVISNAFVLSLEPGIEIIGKLEGLHRFMNWKGGIFTDSGGFQIIRKEFDPVVKEEGVRFRSPYDGTKHLITPERVMEINRALCPDIAMVLDDCPEHSADLGRLEKAVKRTLAWAREAKEVGAGDGVLVFAITQGGTNPALRGECSRELTELDFDGYGIGGLSIGEPEDEMYKMLELSNDILPREKPRYLMGVGSPVQLFESIDRGVDIFDSVFPTRNARHKSVFLTTGRENIRRSNFGGKEIPIEEECGCYTCQNFTRAYVFHMFKSHEMLAQRLVTIHNIHFIQNIMTNIRKTIQENQYLEYKTDFLKHYL